MTHILYISAITATLIKSQALGLLAFNIFVSHWILLAYILPVFNLFATPR